MKRAIANPHCSTDPWAGTAHPRGGCRLGFRRYAGGPNGGYPQPVPQIRWRCWPASPSGPEMHGRRVVELVLRVAWVPGVHDEGHRDDGP